MRSASCESRLSCALDAAASSDSSPVSVWLVAPVIRTGTISPGDASPLKLTALLWRERPRSRDGSVRDVPSTSTSSSRPTKRCARSLARRWTTSTRRCIRSTFCLVRDEPVGDRARLGAAARREDEREGAVVADLLADGQGLREVGLGLAREADDDVRRDRRVGHVLADQRDAVEVALAAVRPAHRLEDPRRARLQRQMDVLADRRQPRVREDHVLAHVLRMRARVADALDAVDRVEPLQQLGERRPRGPEVATVGVDVLAQQRHLAHALERRAGRPRRRARRRDG